MLSMFLSQLALNSSWQWYHIDKSLRDFVLAKGQCTQFFEQRVVLKNEGGTYVVLSLFWLLCAFAIAIVVYTYNFSSKKPFEISAAVGWQRKNLAAAVAKKKIRKSKSGLCAAASSSSSLCSFEESIENLKVGLKYKSQNWFLMGEQFKMMHCFMDNILIP